MTLNACILMKQSNMSSLVVMKSVINDTQIMINFQ